MKMKTGVLAAGLAVVAAVMVFAAERQGVRAAEVGAGEAQKPTVVELWPGKAPGEKGNIGEESSTTTGTAGKDLVTRLTNVSKPTISVYRPAKEKDTGAAVVICPGGAYKFLAIDLEGTEVATWLNSIGVTGIILKYRVPARDESPMHVAPMQDAQRALSVVRAHAAEWKIDPHRVGMMGFSAGAHLTAMVATNFEKRGYEAVDAADKESCRPDFTLLIYPAYIAPFDRLEPPIAVNSKTPPAFLVQTSDDEWQSKNSTHYYAALQASKVPSELHLYGLGGHGYGLRPSKFPVSTWPLRASEWLKSQGYSKTMNDK